MQFSNWVRAALQKTVSFLSPTGPSVGRMRYAPTTGYVRPFKKTISFSSPSGPWSGAYAIRPYNRVRARVQKMDLYTPPSVAYGGAYAIRPYNRVRAALQKTVSFSSPSGPSVGRIRYVPTIGYVRSFEIPMPFPNRIRAILRNTDTISRAEGKGRLGGGAVGATACGGGGRE